MQYRVLGAVGFLLNGLRQKFDNPTEYRQKDISDLADCVDGGDFYPV